MSKDRLLQELTELSFSARCQRLREIGQEAITHSKTAALLDEWEKGNWEERYYCAQSCSGSNDVVRLQRLLDDPSQIIAHTALKLLAYRASDEVLVAVLQKSTHRHRHALLVRLKKQRRLSAIDSFLEIGFREAYPRISELLPLGSAEIVQRLLPIAVERGGFNFWERLSRHQPRLAAQTTLDRLTESEQPDGLMLRCARSVVSLIGQREPDLALQLVKVLAQSIPLSTLSLEPLLRRRPKEMAQIALESEEQAPFSLTGVAQKLDNTVRLRVLHERPAILPLDETWLKRIPASERVEIYRHLSRSWRDEEGLIPVEMLSLLPNTERFAEAERITSLPILATRPQTQAEYAAYLPWDKMKPITDRFLTHPEGEWRGWGWAALLTNLRYHRDRASSVLQLIRKRKFEQDPVRVVILEHLEELPPSLWKEEHRENIAGIIREALDATDLSPLSVAYLAGWVQKLLPNHSEWAAEQLAILYSERGNMGVLELESRLSDSQAQILEAAFLDVGIKWGKGNRIGWLVSFAQGLGCRLRACPRLRQVLEDLLGKESSHYESTIVSLLRRYSTRAEFEKLVQRLIKSHDSWVAITPIFEYLHLHRQDWLAPYLGRTSFSMKGGSRVELISLLPQRGYQRYTEAQQTTLATTLNSLIKLPRGDKLPRDYWIKLRAIQFLALLPAVDPTRLIELSSDVRPVIAEAATRALGRLDGGQGLPTLLAALNDERARVVIYALRQAMVGMPPERVIAAVGQAPLEKVTVAKEVIRLVGEYGGPAGGDWLLEVASRKLHRDVRIAVLRGLWDHLERPESWKLLNEAAKDADGQILNGVVRIPADRLSEDSRRQLIELLSGLVSHADAVVRLRVFQRFIEMPIPDRDGRLISVAMNSLSASSRDERQAAGRVIATNATAADALRIARTVEQLKDQRRPLFDFIQSLTDDTASNPPRRRRLEATAKAILETLRDDPVTAGLRLVLASSIMGPEGLETELRQLSESRFPLSAIVTEATRAVEQVSETVQQKALSRLEEQWASSDDPHLRLLAFIALKTQASDSLRWDEARQARLKIYRADPSPIVSLRAQFYFEADSM
jgi:hypothetical protein